MDDRKWVHKVSDLPAGESFVILENASVYIPGDERSRTCPGHGYPATTEYHLSMMVFSSRKTWEEEINKRITQPRLYPDNEWTAVIMKRPNIKTTVSIQDE